MPATDEMMMHSVASTDRQANDERFGSLPGPPQSVDETGLGFLFLVELLCKVLFLNGQQRLADLATHCRLSLGILDPLLAFMRAERLCEVSGRGETTAAQAYTLTDLGRARAQEYLHKNQYAGVAPVSLAAYVERVKAQSVRELRITKERMRGAFEGLVVRESTLDQFGAALNSGRPIFMYGPAGAGKTYIGEHLAPLFGGRVLVPHAILVENEVIQVFDPLIHQPTGGEAATVSLDRAGALDGRWMACKRPVVITGGELSLAMLDLQFDARARYYQAPPQIKANNGLFIIDDLGRQLVSPQKLMNRWIVPMDRRVDFMALHTGTKFMVPFDVVVIFSSNLAPDTLGDEAFLRRLGYKIHIGALSEGEYAAIFEQACTELGLPFSIAGLRFVLHELHAQQKRPLLACVPRDILAKLRDRAEYLGEAPELSEPLLTWAWNNYFADDRHEAAAATRS